MRQSKYITIITMACALFFASCSDEYMENMNTDPSKAATIDPNAQLTTAQLQTYGDLSMMEIYRNYHYAFTQQLMGCWNTTNYGGRHTLDNNEMSPESSMNKAFQKDGDRLKDDFHFYVWKVRICAIIQ